MKTTVERYSLKMMNEIVDDVLAGRVPADVKDFSELHDHVDANMYGDPDALFVELSGNKETAIDENPAAWNEVLNITDQAMKIVNFWIIGGGIAKFVADRQAAPVVKNSLAVGHPNVEVSEFEGGEYDI